MRHLHFCICLAMRTNSRLFSKSGRAITIFHSQLVCTITNHHYSPLSLQYGPPISLLSVLWKKLVPAVLYYHFFLLSFLAACHWHRQKLGGREIQKFFSKYILTCQVYDISKDEQKNCSKKWQRERRKYFIFVSFLKIYKALYNSIK